MQKTTHDLLRDLGVMTWHVIISASDDCSLESEVRIANWLRDRDRGLRLREFLPRIRISRTGRQRQEAMRRSEVMARPPARCSGLKGWSVKSEAQLMGSNGNA